MNRNMVFGGLAILLVSLIACETEQSTQTGDNFPAITKTFGPKLNPNNLPNYEAQSLPAYITKDNTNGNVINNEVATLGRVLFYDRKLSVTNQISCSSCHIQAFAFSDTAQLSTGINGKTSRHSMRLINARFAHEENFFWDERASSLEEQVTQPIQDHIEMGYSGTAGNLGINDLLNKLMALDYYQELAQLAFGDNQLTEERLQLALAQFVRSIQSFDSKYDAGRQQVADDKQDFPNFSALENLGKRLFLRPIGQSGTSCAGCHNPPEFDIAFSSKNNGVIGVAGKPNEVDLFNTRSPSLRDLVNPQGQLNGPLMHNGEFKTLQAVIEHYNSIPNDDRNTNLDSHLIVNGTGTQQLNLTVQEKQALIAFLKTLGGTMVYTDEKYASPFLNQ